MYYDGKYNGEASYPIKIKFKKKTEKSLSELKQSNQNQQCIMGGKKRTMFPLK